MDLIKTQPDATEICVKKVDSLSSSAEAGKVKYAQEFKGFNDAMATGGR